MPRRKSWCPAESLPDCPCCARAGGRYDFRCRACLVRYLARELPDRRDAVLMRIAEDHGETAAEALRRAVNDSRFTNRPAAS